MKKKILITGSNGLLGQKLVELITKEKDFQLIATARGANRLPENASYSYLPMDITNEGNVHQVITSSNPDHIIHTAAMTNVDQCETEREQCWKQNVEAVRYISDAATKVNAHLLHVSTDFIFDGAAGPYDESAKANPLSYYGESKLAAEEIILASKTPWAIARTVLVYGIAHDMSRTNIILWVKKSLEDGKTIQVVDDQWRTPTLAEDLAQGCYLIAKQGATGMFNISGREMLTPYEMAIKTAEFFKLDKSLINKSDSTKFKQAAQRPARTGFIINKAVSALKYNPHTFEEGIALLARQIDNKSV